MKYCSGRAVMKRLENSVMQRIYIMCWLTEDNNKITSTCSSCARIMLCQAQLTLFPAPFLDIKSFLPLLSLFFDLVAGMATNRDLTKSRQSLHQKGPETLARDTSLTACPLQSCHYTQESALLEPT